MKRFYILTSAVAACVFLYFVEQVLAVDYIIKTLCKIALFVLLPLFYIRFIKKTSFSEALNFKKIDRSHMKLGLFFGIGSFAVILATFFILQGVIDLQGISAEMQTKSRITPANFVLVGVYVTFGNSFLEEFFFRGFIFLNLYELHYKRTAYIFSAVLFGLYHMAIFKTWFNPALIVLALAGLVFIGFIFDWLDTKSDNILNSWLVHILADSAIILIGLKMFNMI